MAKHKETKKEVVAEKETENQFSRNVRCPEGVQTVATPDGNVYTPKDGIIAVPEDKLIHFADDRFEVLPRGK